MSLELRISLLRTFSAVADTGSFTQAGEAVHVTQSAVSMQMKRLEEIVGHPLFRKKGRAIRLTPAGETLLEHAQRILSAHDEAVSAFASPDMFGRIRFGCSEEYTSRFLPRVLADFRKAFPRIRVELYSATSPELTRMLAAEELDLFLRGCRQSGEGGRVIHREPLVWAASRRGTVHMEDPLPLALYHEGRFCREWAIEALRKVKKRYWIAFVSHSVSSILAAVRAGLAVAPIGAGALDDSFHVLGPESGFPLLPVSELSLHESPSADRELVECFSRFVVASFRMRA